MSVLSDTLLGFVKGQEGFSSKPFWDYKQWTSGYGTKGQPGEFVDPSEAERRLQAELLNSRNAVAQRFPNLDGPKLDALTSFTYNVGPGWTQGSGLADAVRSGDWQSAAERLRQYNKAGGKVLPGLVNRRSAEAAMFLGGAPSVASAPASIAPAIPPVLQSGYGRQSGPGAVPPTPAPQSNKAPVMAQGYPSNMLGPLSSIRDRLMNPLTMMGMSILASPTREASEGARIALAARGQQEDMAEAARRRGFEDKAMAEAEAQKTQWRGLLDDPANFEGLPAPVAKIAKALPAEKGGQLILDLIQRRAAAAAEGNPAAIREWEYYNKLPPDQQQRYLDMKRQNMSVVGGDVINKATGQPVANVEDAIRRGEQAKVVGKETGERQMMAPKALASVQSANAKAANVQSAINNAKGMISNWSAGWGSLLSGMPATQALGLREQLKRVVANMGFEELQDMRANSPTGGALGQVAVQELEMLQKTRVSLEQAQKPEELKAALEELEAFMAGAQERRQRAYEATYGQGGGAPAQGQAAAPAAPRAMDLGDGFTLEGP